MSRGSTIVIGLCSKCGGHVLGDISGNKAPKCEKCGAEKKHNWPVIQMEESSPTQQLLQE